MKISQIQENLTPASTPSVKTIAPKFGRSDEMLESGCSTTSSSSIATVSAPMGKMQKRGKGSMFQGIQTSEKFANSRKAGIKESYYNHDDNRTGFSKPARQDDERNSEFDDKMRKLTGMIFYNVDDTDLAQQLGLKQTRTGKWFLRTGNRNAQQAADSAFGQGKIWYPKNESLGESWKEDAAAHDEFLAHARQQLQAANPAERDALAVRLSNLEKKHFGDEVGQGWSDMGISSPKPGALSAGILGILQSVVNTKPSNVNVQNMPFGSVTTTRLSPEDIAAQREQQRQEQEEAARREEQRKEEIRRRREQDQANGEYETDDEDGVDDIINNYKALPPEQQEDFVKFMAGKFNMSVETTKEYWQYAMQHGKNAMEPEEWKQQQGEVNENLTQPTSAVDAKGRTQQQWMQAVKARFPDAKIMRAKMIDGPCQAILPDGRKLFWNKVEQGVAEGLGKDIKRLATGKDVKSRAGQEIAKSQDASMKGDTKTSKKHFDRYDKLDKLANKDQGMAEGLPQTLRKVVPGYAKREIDKKMDDQKFGRTDVDKDANYYRYKKIQDKIKNKGVAEGEQRFSRAAKGNEKYGKDGMKALAKAGRDGASEEKMDKIRDKHDNYNESWSQKYKSSINCSNPKGFSQKAHCAGKKNNESIEENFNPEYDDEAGMAETNLHTIARSAQGLIDVIGQDENLPEWCQEKIAKVEGMLVAVWDYLESQEEQGIDPQVDEDWQKTNKQDKTDGMSGKAVKAYRRENPGSKLKTAVTTKPSELKAGSKDANRRKSFCARMSGNKGPMKDEKGRPTPKAKALRRWNCESVEQTVQMLESVQRDLSEVKQRLDPKCWKGFKKQGTKMKGDTRVNNCVPVSEAEVSEDKIANDLYKDFQIFKKGADKGIGSKAKAKDISSKAKDKDIIAKEGAKVDRMVGHVKSSEKKLGHSDKEAENIAWATANKRGMLNNKNKK